MRTIKFRAWDKIHKKMGFVTSLDWMHEGHQRGIMIDSDSGFNIALNEDEYELLQFTGLLDKNGNEIFENDIINILLHFSDGEFQCKAVIKYDNGAFWFDAEKEGYTDCNWHFYNQEDREIIGNIYENAELLK